MDTVRIIDILPKCYEGFLPSFFASPIMIESAATCKNCAMLQNNVSHQYAAKFFSAKTKCCTHYPELPNYLVGALISTTDPDRETGRQRLRNTIANRIGVTPLGILRPKKYTLLIKNANPDYFGRSEVLRCPFYDSRGLCTVFPYWDAVCSTWFCKHGAGEEGKRFWRVLRKYLEKLEKILARYALLKIGFNLNKPGLVIDESAPLTLQELDDLPPLVNAYQELWGEWSAKEADMYKECYKLIAQLRQDDFANMEGIELKILLAELEQEYEQMMSSPLPELLRKSPVLTVEKISDSSYLLAGYSPFDPLRVSKRLYDCLDFFDGARSNQEVLRLCHETYKIRLTGNILKKLHQFQILVAAGET